MQAESPARIGEILAARGWVTQGAVASALAAQAGLGAANPEVKPPYSKFYAEAVVGKTVRVRK